MEKLRRSKRNKVIFGVCSGISDYLRIDVTLIRIITILVTFMGPGIILYIVAALIMPEEKDYSPFDNQWGGSQNTGSYNADPFAGSGTGTGNSTGNATGTGMGADNFESDFNTDSENWDTPKYRPEKSKFILGAVLVVIGILFLIGQVFPVLFNPKLMIPLIMIVIGGLIVFRGRK
ncbi:MAG TPA: PspC domain-containing protein [Clostridia bacterium]|nr:PspC domain-containing protein [Clostridia bacterium]